MPELAVDPTATLLHHQSEWLTSGQSRHTVVDVSPATLLGATNGNRFASRTAWRWTVEHLGQHYPKAVTLCHWCRCCPSVAWPEQALLPSYAHLVGAPSRKTHPQTRATSRGAAALSCTCSARAFDDSMLPANHWHGKLEPNVIPRLWN